MVNLLYYDYLRCLVEVLVFSTAGYCLLAVWVALGRGPWFVRALVGCAAVGILIPIRAYAPALLFAATVLAASLLLAVIRYRTAKFQACCKSDLPVRCSSKRRILVVAAITSCVTTFLIWIRVSGDRYGWYDRLLVLSFIGPILVVLVNSIGQRLLHGRCVVTKLNPDDSPRIRFELRNMLLSVGVIAIVFGIVTVSVKESLIEDWKGFSVSTLCLVAITCSACGLLVSVRWYWRVMALLLLIASLIATPYTHVWWSSDWLRLNTMYWFGSPAEVMVGLCIFSVALALNVLGGIFILRAAGWIQMVTENSDRPKIVTWPARFAVVAGLSGVYLPMTLLYVRMLGPFEVPDGVVAKDNGYSQLIAATLGLQESNMRERTLAQLRGRGLNQRADEIAKRYQVVDNLSKQSFTVPLDFSQASGPDYVGSLQAEVRSFRSLARTWDNESQEAVGNKQFDQASEQSLSNIRLGSRLSVGGLIVHSLVGIAVEGVGQGVLGKIRNDVSTKKAAELLRSLESIDSQRESMSAIVTRINAWSDHAETWRFRLAFHSPLALTGRNQQGGGSSAFVSPSLRAIEDAMKRRDVVHRLLMIELALRLYKDQHAVYPAELSQLVPDFLANVPVDPYSGDPFIYRQDDASFLLYSVSRDGDDDGGKFGKLSNMYDEEYDFDLESLYR